MSAGSTVSSTKPRRRILEQRGVTREARLDLLHAPAGLARQPEFDVTVVASDLFERVEQDVDTLSRFERAQVEDVRAIDCEAVRAQEFDVVTRVSRERLEIDAERRHHHRARGRARARPTGAR